MVDTATRGFLLTLLVAVIVVAAVVYRRSVRPSRRGSIVAMLPTLSIWVVFETWVLADGDLEMARWLSRLGVIAIAATFLYQLWSIDYSEQVEQRIRDNGQ